MWILLKKEKNVNYVNINSLQKVASMSLHAKKLLAWWCQNLTNPTKTCQTLPKTFQILLKPAKTFQTYKNIPKDTKLPKTYHTHQKHAKTYTVVCHIVHITAKMQTNPNQHMKNINYRRRICRASMLVLFVNVGATTSSFGTSIHLYITYVKTTKCKNGGFCWIADFNTKWNSCAYLQDTMRSTKQSDR